MRMNPIWLALWSLLTPMIGWAGPDVKPSIPAKKPNALTENQEPSKPVVALFEAAKAGEDAAVLSLLAKGVPVDSKIPNGLTPLMIAAIMNHPSTVKLLLDHGADVNATLQDGTRFTGQTALMMASCEDMNSWAGADFPPPPAGWDKQPRIFAKTHPKEMTEWRAQVKSWMKGYGEIVRLLVEHGADVNAQTRRGDTAMIAVVRYGEGDTDTAQYLLEHGARLDLPVHQKDPINGKDVLCTNGYQALLAATDRRSYDPAMLKLLLAHGAKPDTDQPLGQTPLDQAARISGAECVKALIAAGAKVNAYNNFGVTALMEAKSPQVIKLLRQAGAQDLPIRAHYEIRVIRKAGPQGSVTYTSQAVLIPQSVHKYGPGMRPVMP